MPTAKKQSKTKPIDIDTFMKRLNERLMEFVIDDKPEPEPEPDIITSEELEEKYDLVLNHFDTMVIKLKKLTEAVFTNEPTLRARHREIQTVLCDRVEKGSQYVITTFDTAIVGIHDRLDKLHNRIDRLDKLQDRHDVLLKEVDDITSVVYDNKESIECVVKAINGVVYLIKELEKSDPVTTDNLKHIEADFVSINNNNMERFNQLDENVTESLKTIEFVVTEHLQKTDKKGQEQIAFLSAFVKEIDKVAFKAELPGSVERHNEMMNLLRAFQEKSTDRFVEIEDRNQRRHNEIMEKLGDFFGQLPENL